MHRRTNRRFDCLQVDTAALAAVSKNHAQQVLYFLRDLFLDGLRRFFSCADGSASSMGRR
jgi:hypothetical protein